MASFFLIQAEPGLAAPMAQLLANMPGVYDASVTSGPYDVIAEVTPDLEHQQRIAGALRRTSGLTRLCVCRGSELSSVMA